VRNRKILYEVQIKLEEQQEEMRLENYNTDQFI
jgi:hypothetical protein